MIPCARPGCNKPCVGDGYCSADCCRIDHGLRDAPTEHELEIQRRRTETIRSNARSRSIRGLRPKPR